jgi:uncharacterized protein YndB with AHSA1/START domain
MNSTSTELVISRVFDAPREVVYRAWTDPDQVAQWFAPAGWSVPRDSVEIDLRPGGVQRFTMVNDSDPAQTSPVDAVFLEVVPNELLVGAEDWDPTGERPVGEKFTLRVEFADEDGKTRLTIRQGPYPAGDILSQANAGWTTALDKLDTLLAR